jgi:hypothetical protein
MSLAWGEQAVLWLADVSLVSARPSSGYIEVKEVKDENHELSPN